MIDIMGSCRDIGEILILSSIKPSFIGGVYSFNDRRVSSRDN
jgi:hypothetical protein